MSHYRFNKEESERLNYKGSDGGDKSVLLEPGKFYHLPEDNGVVKHMVVTKVLIVPEGPDAENTPPVLESKWKVDDAVVCAAHGFKMTVQEVDGDDVTCSYNDNENVTLTGVYKADALTAWEAPERVPGTDGPEN